MDLIRRKVIFYGIISTLVFFFTGLPLLVNSMAPPIAQSSSSWSEPHIRHRRDVTLNNRTRCNPQEPLPPSRVNTTQQLKILRSLMNNVQAIRGNRLSAYIIPTDDQHQSEYVSPHDQRRAFISGFSGSAGIAVVTMDKAALWTDGRYFLQAEDQLDCNWILMKTAVPGVPKLTEWLTSVLQTGEVIGADPKLVGADKWLQWNKELESSSLRLAPVNTNLIDILRTELNVRTQQSKFPIFVHDLKYAGKSWEDKVTDLRKYLKEHKPEIDVMVLSALDEIAWLFNLRGRDIPYSPVFFSYALVTPSNIILYLQPNKVTEAVKFHLKSNGCNREDCVRIEDYDSFFTDLPRQIRKWDKVLLPSRCSYSGGASYAIYQAVQESQRVTMKSPVLLMKSRKNAVEIQGMQRAHIKDAAALCKFLAQLEEEMDEGVEKWDELKAEKELEKCRKEQKDNQGLSFETIAAFGPNGAVIHYTPTPSTNRQITNQSLFLLDSGGQYLDGTTDVTRTLHYGIPTEFQKEMYTRVLMGTINLASAIVPNSVSDTDIDILARSALYEVGLDYRHGTGHGIGAFLNVHEGPTLIRFSGIQEHEFEDGQFFSDEPGFYKDYEFGIRLETILRVVKKETKYSGFGEYIAFEPVTLVPFEPKLIIPEMMSVKQRKWLNNYNALVRQKVGEELKVLGYMKAFHWVMAKTGYIDESVHGVASSERGSITSIVILLTLVTLFGHKWCTSV